MTSTLKLDLYLMVLYRSVKFDRNCGIPSKVIDRKPQFSQNLCQKRAITELRYKVFHVKICKGQ